MDEDIKIFGCLPSLIEIPADVLLYWTLKATELKGVVTEQDLQRYRNAIASAYNKYQSDIKETLAFNFPYGNNYQHEIFEEVILSDGKIGFRIKKARNKKAKELLEYRLVKLEAFSKMQKPTIRKMFILANSYYLIERPTITYTLQKGPTVKQKVLKLIDMVREKLDQK